MTGISNGIYRQFFIHCCYAGLAAPQPYFIAFGNCFHRHRRYNTVAKLKVSHAIRHVLHSFRIAEVRFEELVTFNITYNKGSDLFVMLASPVLKPLL